jgi:hypothetical protein
MQPNDQHQQEPDPSLNNVPAQAPTPQVIVPQQTAPPVGGSSMSAPADPQPTLQNVPPIQNTPNVAGPAPMPKSRWPKKRLALLAVGLVVLLGGSASAYYFGVVVPNNPENLWQTALDRTAKGYDELVKYADANKEAKGVHVSGDYKVEGSYATDGTFDVQTYEKNGLVKFDVGVVGSRVNVEGRFIAAANSDNPDIYVKATGIKGLGSMLGEFAPLAQQYDDQWLFVDHTLLDNLESTALKQAGDKDAASATTLTGDDVTKISQAVGEVNKEYIFTTDSNKAVLTVVKQVGKEQKDGRSVYHYEAGIHKQHAKDYVNALVDRLQNTPATKLTNGKKIRDAVDVNSMLKAIDNYKESDTAHVYVDMKTKLIGIVRIDTGDKKQNYIEVSQNYKGGDVVPFKLALSSDVSDGTTTMVMGLNINKKSNTADGNMALEGPGEKGEKAKASMKFTVTPNNKALDIQKPQNAKSIYELLGPVISGALGGAVEDMPGVSDNSEI